LNFPPDASDPDARQCDQLADHPLDPQRVGDGVKMPMIDVAQALPPCERAASRVPARPRYQYIYGRVLEAASRPADAVNQYVLAERAGYAMADFNLALAYQNGIGVTRSRDRALEFLTRADTAGVKDVRAAAGDLFLYGTPPDYAQAKTWYESAIERDEPQGYAGLAVLYDFGYGVSQDRIKGAGFARRAADLGNVNGMYWTGKHFMDGQGFEKDPLAACQWFDKAARENYSYAQLEIGRCFYNGLAGERNHESAFYWLIRAARAGLPQAQELVAGMYDSADGVAGDEVQAAAWYRKAAEQDDVYGMMQLGAHFRQGKGVAWSEAEAMRWFEKAARKGYAAAQSSLAQGYLAGLGQSAGQGRQDYQQAAYWFDLAAKQGEGFAQLNLGVMYENGWAVPQDLDRAKQFYAQASQSSNAAAAKVGKEYHDALASATSQAQASQRSRTVGKPSNSDAWLGIVVAAVAVAAVAEIFGVSSSSSESSDRSYSGTVPSGGSDYTPNWNYSSPTPVAVDPPTRPSLYYPSNPTRPVNGDLTDPSIARR
jgi:TPR repeat protein